MTNSGGNLYLVASDKLYRVNPSSGEWTKLIGQGSADTTWPNTTTMTAGNGTIYMISNGNIYSVDPEHGNWTKLDDRELLLVRNF